MLRLESVSVSAGTQSLLHNISLELMSGEIVTVVGPNGAGKTTLLRVVLGLLPCSGTRTLRPGLRIGYMPQKLELNSQLPLNVKRFLQCSTASDENILRAAAQTGIEKILSHPLTAVSGGELQRVLLTRALVNHPDLLVLDEPAQGVDIHGQAEMYRLIHQIKTEQNCAVLMVSHDLHWVMAQTDKVICLNQHICCQGHPDHITQDPAFIELFGSEVSENLAPYTHHHDHNHDLQGNVLLKAGHSCADTCSHSHSASGKHKK